jgi:hypothetical protein
MSYYPKSQIKPNLYTNGEEYILSTTKEEYKGHYYKISTGKYILEKIQQINLIFFLISIHYSNITLMNIFIKLK